MHPGRPIVSFAVKSALVFGVLAIPLFGFQELYGSALRAGGNLLFHRFGSRGMVRFMEQSAKSDTRIRIANREMLRSDGTALSAETEVSSRFLGYIPTALVAALTLTTPVPWRRKAWACLWGVVLVNVLVLLKLVIVILFNFRHSESLQLFQIKGFWEKALDFSFQHFVQPTDPMLIATVLLWIAVSFRRGDSILMLPRTES